MSVWVIIQSVWSDDEYYVWLGNIPHSMVDADTLADNIISDKFPDQDYKLFDVNEFLCLNQGPDLEIVLKFQPSQY